MRLHGQCWKTLVLSASVATAQTVTPFNWTSENEALFNGTQLLILSVAVGERAMSPITRIFPITQGAGAQISPSGIVGPVFLASPDVQLDISSSDIVLISCDPSDYPGNIHADGVFSAAQSKNASSIIFYSREGDGCKLTDYQGSYQLVFSTQSSTDALRLVQRVNTSSIKSTYLGIGLSSNGPTNPSASSQSTPGTTTGTTVAMIVLYSITGVITALFLIIIVTGAIRAHRHPERYGPRPAVGSTRQSRAKGLAKAMLESLPIVKFSGERQDPKDLDHELESGRNLSASPSNNPHLANSTNQNQSDHQTSTTPNPIPGEHPSQSDAIAIAPPEALGAATLSPHSDSADIQGCSICTEDFKHGQDQRVLPCDHRFHPACVDPWLLNVSATCPLCRIDLRPAQSGPDGDHQTLPPPLGTDMSANGHTEESERERGSRRSLILSMLGVHRPEGMSREQRIEALRAYQERRRRISRRQD